MNDAEIRQLVESARPEWFGGRLYELRTAAGMSRKGLAAATGLHEQTLRQYESDGGDTMPGWRAVLSLCRAMNLSPLDFMVKPARLSIELRRGPKLMQEFEYRGWTCVLTPGAKMAGVSKANRGASGWVATCTQTGATLEVAPTKTANVSPAKVRLAIDRQIDKG